MHMPAGVSGCLSDGIARHAGKCWRWLSCLIFGRIYGELSSLRWLQKFLNSDGMLAHWYMLLGQFSVTFEYHPGAQHANADGMSRQCGQCMRPGCPVSSPDSRTDDTGSTTGLLDQPFHNLGNGGFHGCGFITGAVRGNVGGSHLSGGTYGGLAGN